MTARELRIMLTDVSDQQMTIKELRNILFEIADQDAQLDPMTLTKMTHTTNSTRYIYGMRMRGFSLGCQPMLGFVERRDDPTGRYHDLIVYDRKLADDEVCAYELDYIGTQNEE